MSRLLPRYLVPITGIGALVGGVILFKEYTGGVNYTTDERMPGKTVIVTGANTGIGKETARCLAKKGARVIMACRDLEKCETTRRSIVEESFNRNVHCHSLDLASRASIREFAHVINKGEKRLDVLVNNAGVMGCPKTLTTDGIEMQLGVNHLGHFLLTSLLLDKLKGSSPSRVINLVTPMYARGKINFEDLNSAKSYDPIVAYYQSKLAVALFTKELAEQLEGSGVSVYAVYPGAVKTELGRHMSMNKSYFSGYVLGPIWWLMFKTPRQGAQSSVYCALEPSIARDSGKLYSNCKENPWEESVLDDATAKRLWAISERWSGLKPYKAESVKS